MRRIRVPRETALYGRDAELAKLRALYARAKSGDGQVVLIHGEAGIGKTRLVDEFVVRLASEGEDMNFLFGSYPPGGAATASGALSTAYREFLGVEGIDEAVGRALPQTPRLVPASSPVSFTRWTGALSDAISTMFCGVPSRRLTSSGSFCRGVPNAAPNRPLPMTLPTISTASGPALRNRTARGLPSI